MKLAAVVILYHPQQSFISNILSYYHHVEKLYVYDNTESTSGKAYFDGLNKVDFMYDGKNEGIAKRLNQCCTLAQQEGYNWLLTMDQDSCFSEAAIENYLQCANSCSNDESIAMFGITPTDDANKQSTKECNGIDIPLILTSGSLLNISIASKIGGFEENFFIDALDFDFCLKARLNRYKTIRFENIFMLHSIGEQVYRASLKTLFIVKKKKWIHGPLRCYYILRNMLYLEKKYGVYFPEFINQHIFLVTKHLQRSLWYGHHFFKTWWYLQKAKRDFKKKVTGKFGKK